MQLLDKLTSFLPKKQNKQEYFFALIFKEKGIKAIVWEEVQGQVRIIDNAYCDAKKPLIDLSDEELLTLVDQAIGLAEKTLSQDTKTTKTIFGLLENWADKNTIKEPYFSKIKKICRELELSPLGFVVIDEAVVHQLKREEGTPPTMLLIKPGDIVSVTLVQAGRIETSKMLPRSGKSASETAAEIIKSFGDVEILPSRMLLLDGGVDVEEIKHEFVSFPWTKQLSFLHFPKIDILPDDFDGRAVISGAAKEMGFIFENAPAALIDVAEDTASSELEDVGKPHPQEQEPVENVVPVSTTEDTFGFVADKDIADDIPLEASQTDIDEDEQSEEKEPVINDPAQKQPKTNDQQSMATAYAVPLEMQTAVATPPPTKHQLPHMPSLPKMNFGSIGPAIFSFTDTVTHSLHHLRFGLPILLPIFLFVGIFLIAYIFVPRATITLVADARSLENDTNVSIDTNGGSVDKDQKRIPGTTVETVLEGEKSIETTGKKQVGDRATGEVTIYNKTENRKTFPKGTVLTGPNSLRFTLTEDVTIASTSAFELTPTSTKAKVTADQIGEESNIAAGTNLPFKDFPTSSYFAKNEAALTGGTKRDVVVVSRDDQEKLLADLTTELSEKAKDELKTKGEGLSIVDINITQEVDSKKFSKNIGDEAKEVSLNVKIKFSTIAYKNDDLLTLIQGTIEKQVPESFTFQKDTFETTVKSMKKEKSGTISLVVHYKAALLPSLDQQKIKDAITGKSKPAVENYLHNLPIKGYTITENINFPPPLNLLPQRQENIEIEVKTE